MAVAAAVETCWLTMAEKSVSKPSARRRSGKGPVSASAAAKRGSRAARCAAPSATSSSGLDDASDHARRL